MINKVGLYSAVSYTLILIIVYVFQSFILWFFFGSYFHCEFNILFVVVFFLFCLFIASYIANDSFILKHKEDVFLLENNNLYELEKLDNKLSYNKIGGEVGHVTTDSPCFTKTPTIHEFEKILSDNYIKWEYIDQKIFSDDKALQFVQKNLIIYLKSDGRSLKKIDAEIRFCSLNEQTLKWE